MPHAVPLPRQAIAVLKHLQPLTDHGPESFIFPDPGKAGRLSENTLCKVLRTIGFDVTAHGLRSLITDALYEAGFRSEALERQFAHADHNVVRAAYLRSDFLDYRDGMMQHWANMVDALKAGKALPKLKVSNVLPMRTA